MFFAKCLRSLVSHAHNRACRRRSSFSPRVEQLEDRLVPSFTPVSVGSLDPTFGNGGRMTAPYSPTGDWISAVAVQSNGQIIAGGSSTAADGTPDSAFARYNPNGTLDPSFGNAGFIRTDFGSNVKFQVGTIVLEPDGNIVLGGVAIGSSGTQDFALAEYNPNGTLDTSFGNGGWLTTDFHGNADWAFGLAIQSNGQIVAAGLSYHANGPGDFALARYNPDGSLDPSFGQGGLVTTNFGDQFYDVAYGVTIQSNGQIVVAGFSESSSGNYSSALARYNSDGSLDTHFGTGGLVTNDFGSNSAIAKTVTVQANGAILVGGWISRATTGTDFALARYNSDGSLDTSFGQGGLTATDFAGQDDYLMTLAVQPDGKILAAGSSQSASNSPGFALARYNADGSLDTGFGTGGKVATDFGGDGEALGIALQSDGSILAVGGTSPGNTTQLALARYVVSPNEIYVDNLYQLLLHRPADPSSAYWVNQLNQGASPTTIVKEIEQSPEYLNNVVTSLYEHYLLRAPDTAGAQYWLTALENGSTIEQVIDGIVSSSEFFQNEGGGTDGGYVTALYQYILDRAPDASGYTVWLDALNNGTSRAAVAAAFLASQEYQSDLVSSYYWQFLKRPVSAGELAAWVGDLQAGFTDQVVQAGIAGSPESVNDWS